MNPKITLAAGMLNPPAGSGYQAQPANGATITPYSSDHAPTPGYPRAHRFSRLNLFIVSSHDSAVNGVIVETSIDGQTWDTYYTTTYKAGTVLDKDILVEAPYIRNRYVNSANDLTVWRYSLTAWTKDRALGA